MRAIRCPMIRAATMRIVVLGGGQNALADDEYPYIPALLALMRDFSATRQVGARHLPRQPASGARLRWPNMIGTAPEFGWSTVRLTGRGRGRSRAASCSADHHAVPVARRHVLAAAWRAAACDRRCGGEPGLSHRPRHLWLPVPFRGRPPAGAGMERRLRGLSRRTSPGLAATARSRGRTISAPVPMPPASPSRAPGSPPSDTSAHRPSGTNDTRGRSCGLQPSARWRYRWQRLEDSRLARGRVAIIQIV